MSSTTGAIQAWGSRGAAPISSVKVTYVPRQYWVSGWPGNSCLTGDWDGEWEGALPNTPVSSRSFRLLGGMRVWPSVRRLAPDIWSSKSLDLAAIDRTVVVMNWNSRLDHTIQVQRPSQKIKKHWVCTNCILSMVIGNPFIHHQQTPLQTWGHFQPGKR